MTWQRERNHPHEFQMQMITGQTNVRSARFGAGAIDGIGKELGRFVVTTMEVPWRMAQRRLGAPPVAVIHVENMEIGTLGSPGGRGARV